MKTRRHSARAIDAAIEAMGCPHPRTAAVTLFLAAARHLGHVLDDPKAASELAYIAADELATEGDAAR